MKLRARQLAICLLAAAAAGVGGCVGAAGDGALPEVPKFDAQRAYDLIVRQCSFGPRNPGSDGHEACRQWIVQQLQPAASRIVEQQFSAETPFGGPYQFCNILALFEAGGGKQQPVLIAAHWDTRPVADMDPDPELRNQPILGANDGASGVAVLLELARIMAQDPPPVPVILAFLDAEDSGRPDRTDLPYMGFCIGSRYLANNWPAELPRPAEGILLDMVGGDGRTIPRIPYRPDLHGDPAFDLLKEPNSLSANAALVEEIWSLARRLGHSAFKDAVGAPITDDHLPLTATGIPTIDIIEAFPVAWHTAEDTPEHCSAESLYQVGDTLVHWVYIEKRAQRRGCAPIAICRGGAKQLWLSMLAF